MKLPDQPLPPKPTKENILPTPFESEAEEKTLPKTFERRDTRGQDVRVMKIHRALNAAFDRKKFVTCASLAATCGVTPRQIIKDIAHMRDDLMLPFVEKTSQGYAYEERVDFIPHLLMSQKMCYCMLLSIKSGGTYLDDPEYRAMKRTFHRISAALRETAKLDIEEMDRCLSFSGMLRPKVDPQLINFVWRCAVEKIQLRVTYHTPGKKKVTDRFLDPYHIRKLRREWVAYCWDSERKGPFRFSIGRMSNVKASGKKFEVSPEFSLEEELNGVMEIFKGDEIVDVIVHVKKKKAHIIRENDVACEVGRKEVPNKAVEIHLRVSSFVDLLDLLRGDLRGSAIPLHPPDLVKEWRADALHDLRAADAVIAGTFRKEHAFMEELKHWAKINAQEKAKKEAMKKAKEEKTKKEASNQAE